jgi:hypothetical protein
MRQHVEYRLPGAVRRWPRVIARRCDQALAAPGSCYDAQGWLGEGGKNFFFEKKKRKTFDCFGVGVAG